MNEYIVYYKIRNQKEYNTYTVSCIDSKQACYIAKQMAIDLFNELGGPNGLDTLDYYIGTEKLKLIDAEKKLKRKIKGNIQFYVKKI